MFLTHTRTSTRQVSAIIGAREKWLKLIAQWVNTKRKEGKISLTVKHGCSCEMKQRGKGEEVKKVLKTTFVSRVFLVRQSTNL
jgi:hypothetical protein